MSERSITSRQYPLSNEKDLKFSDVPNDFKGLLVKTLLKISNLLSPDITSKSVRVTAT